MQHFTKTALKTIFAILSLNFIGCYKYENNTGPKKEALLFATQNFNDLNKLERTLKIYSDSTFIFNEILNEPNHSKNETFKGFIKIKKDTLKFFPFELEYNNAETAVLKNGFVKFIDGKYPDRMKIEKTSLSTLKNIDFSKLPNLAVFTYYKNFHTLDSEKDLSNYDLSTEEVEKINVIFKTEFKKNNKLKNYDHYLKQIVAVRNSKNEILIKAHIFCKNSNLAESYEYYETSMMDGGNCNVYLELNLTTGKFNFINIAGLA
ncbi:hypothetical protein [Chryseobacterium sp. MDT2-18]|uniref:hypothetical protein n=1 Tax=Chryseobacterium sp. MDT2-18 TaxID=1259136 RepID=UPI0027828B4C|nr:hypothetical protein [Chryseobacterium sp. MDT2-18]MDQ0477061.1 hypothetical protein [Chryseobacterium sp. MDT2-18]